MTKKVSFNLHHNYVLLISMQFITTLKRVSHKSCHVCGLKKNATLCRLRYSFAPSTAIKHWVTKLSLFIFLVLNAVQCISSSSNKKKFIPIWLKVTIKPSGSFATHYIKQLAHKVNYVIQCYSNLLRVTCGSLSSLWVCYHFSLHVKNTREREWEREIKRGKERLQNL